MQGCVITNVATFFLEYFTPDDVEKLEIIKREVLITEATREQRKARVSKYRRWVSYRDQPTPCETLIELLHT